MEGKHKMPEFYFDKLYRYVKTYHYTYHTNTKARWIKRSIFDVFTSEFKAFDAEYYKNAIEEGRIRVNNKHVGLDYVLKANDKIEHDAIRKEPPIYKYDIPIIYEDNNFLIINKPPSIPIHVCGSYLHNTVISLLKYEKKYKELYTLHRLDKLTSGLLMLSKSEDLAFKFHDDLKNKRVQKLYIARVHGNFPVEVGQELTINKPIYCSSPKLSKYDVCKVEEIEQLKAKIAETIFKKLWYDEETDTSLIECQPVTGKTHQIRVHCKSLGHPIVNDRSYGGKFVGNLIENEILKNDQLKEEAKLKEEIDKKVHKLEDNNNELEPDLSKKVKPNEDKEEKASEDKEEKKVDTNEANAGKSVDENSTDKVPETKDKEEKKEEKVEKAEKKKSDEDEEFNEDEKTYIMEIWLHSQRYRYKEYEFEAPYPYWAKKEFKFNIQEI